MLHGAVHGHRYRAETSRPKKALQNGGDGTGTARRRLFARRQQRPAAERRPLARRVAAVGGPPHGARRAERAGAPGGPRSRAPAGRAGGGEGAAVRWQGRHGSARGGFRGVHAPLAGRNRAGAAAAAAAAARGQRSGWQRGRGGRDVARLRRMERRRHHAPRVRRAVRRAAQARAPPSPAVGSRLRHGHGGSLGRGGG